MYKEFVESMNRIQIRCVKTCSTELFPKTGRKPTTRAYLHSDNVCNATPCAVSESDNIFGVYDETQMYQTCVKRCDNVVWFITDRVTGTPEDLETAETTRNNTLGFVCQSRCKEGEHANDARAYVRMTNITLRNRQYTIRLCQAYCSESLF